MSDIILALNSPIQQAGLHSVLAKRQHKIKPVPCNANEIKLAAQGLRLPILFLDESHSKGSIRTLVRRLKNEQHGLKIIVNVDNLSHALDLKLTEKQIDGFLFNYVDIDEVEKAIRVVSMGGNYSPHLLTEAARRYKRLNEQHPVFSGLSRREAQIFQLIATGLTVPDISRRLFISRKTVNTFRYRLYQKLNVKGDVQLTHLAYEYGLVSLDLMKRCDLYPQTVKGVVDKATALRVAELKRPAYDKKIDTDHDNGADDDSDES